MKVGVVGAGFMGTGIAECTAKAGYRTVVHEPDGGVLRRSEQRLLKSLERAADAGKIEGPAVADTFERIEYSARIDALGGCEVVLEAVSEDVDLKTSLFRSLEEIVPPDALLASNTSSIPIARLAAAVANRERVVGLHFFSPVPMMSLVEVVVAISSDERAVSQAHTFAESLGKTPIRTKDRSGFVVNMLLVPYLMAAVRMFEEGFASREDIDTAMKLGCGHPMGPLALCDLIGLDVLDSVCSSLFDEFKRPEYAPPPLLERMVIVGHTGRKAGRGFYEYD